VRSRDDDLRRGRGPLPSTARAQAGDIRTVTVDERLEPFLAGALGRSPAEWITEVEIVEQMNSEFWRHNRELDRAIGEFVRPD
jgi:hypothetical protein